MSNKNLETAAKLLGVSSESLIHFPEDIQNSMAAVIGKSDIKTEEDTSIALDELMNIWNKAVIAREIAEIAKVTGILPAAIKKLPEQTQQRIIYEYGMNEDAAETYKTVQNALATIDLPDVAELLSKSVSELEQLPLLVQTQLCGTYSMERGLSEDEELIELLNELIQLAL